MCMKTKAAMGQYVMRRIRPFTRNCTEISRGGTWYDGSDELALSWQASTLFGGLLRRNRLRFEGGFRIEYLRHVDLRARVRSCIRLFPSVARVSGSPVPGQS
jgi:hypothetical protein